MCCNSKFSDFLNEFLFLCRKFSDNVNGVIRRHIKELSLHLGLRSYSRMFLVTFTISKTSHTTAPAQGVVQGKTTGPLTVFTIFGSVGLRHFTARELVNYYFLLLRLFFHAVFS